MSNTSDSVIAEVLKLYDMIDEHKIPNKVQLPNVLEQSIIFESDNAIMGSLCSKSQEKELRQPQQVHVKAKDSCMECFRLLHSNLKVLLERPGSMGG